MKQIQIVFCLLILISCNETVENKSNSESQKNQDSSIIGAIHQIRFTDIIPENTSDSLKTEIIKQLVNDIDIDTLLMHKVISDSLNSDVYVFYRNDTMVKIGQRHMSYYFLKDRLILARYRCIFNQHTGRCDPVSAFSDFYFYNKKVINQTHDIRIKYPYGGCGCRDLSPYEKKDNIAKYETITTTEINRLKELIKTAKWLDH
jgi:hypothetical protein